MKKTQILLGSTLCLGLMTGLSVPVNATTEVTIEVEETDLNNNIGYVEDKNGDGIPDADMSEFSVTVPAVLPIVFNSDGTNLLPTEWKITNHSSISNISVAKLELNANDSGWTLLPASKNISDLPADSQSIKFYMGKSKDELILARPVVDEGTIGSCNWENGTFVIPANSSANAYFNVERGAYTTTHSEIHAFDMLLTFEFIQ